MGKDTTKKLNQNEDTDLQVQRGKRFSLRYAYKRSRDSQKGGEPGQDFLAHQIWENSIRFALCDGVSQSFFGDLAARLLGDALIMWLDRTPDTLETISIVEHLSTYLTALSKDTAPQIQAHPLPDGLSPMIQEVLEEKRSLGSESTFVCGRIDLPGSAFPQGRVLLAWMGDSRVRLWGQEGENVVQSTETLRTEQRWSTSRGLVEGDPHVFVQELVDKTGNSNFTGVMAYSDGISSLDEFTHPPSNLTLENLIIKESEAATSDDISFIEIWTGEPPGAVFQQQTNAPRKIKSQVKGNQVALSWRPHKKASAYEIEVRDEYSKYWRTKKSFWKSDELPPGDFDARVRIVTADNELGAWTEPIPIHIEAPPEPIVPVTEPEEEAKEPKRARWYYPAGGGVVLVLILLFAFTPLGELLPFFKGTETPTVTATITKSPTPLALPETFTPESMETSEVTPSPPATSTPTIIESPTTAETPTETNTLTPTSTTIIPTSTSTSTSTSTETSTPTSTGTTAPTETETSTPSGG